MCVVALVVMTNYVCAFLLSGSIRAFVVSISMGLDKHPKRWYMFYKYKCMRCFMSGIRRRDGYDKKVLRRAPHPGYMCLNEHESAHRYGNKTHRMKLIQRVLSEEPETPEDLYSDSD